MTIAIINIMKTTNEKPTFITTLYIANKILCLCQKSYIHIIVSLIGV